MVSACAVAWVSGHGFTLYWGDAESHLNHARRIVEARCTGYDQLGSPWLPLPHLLMVPLVVKDSLWQSGLAGAIPCAACFVAAATMLFAAVRRVLGIAGAWCATALFVLNPNALYLQSIPMTEAVFFAAFTGVLLFTVRYTESQSMGDVIGAALMCMAGTMARYEGWFFIPFIGLYVLMVSTHQRIVRSLLFGVVASAGCAWWFYYNWYLTGNALNFYNGPDSAMAIQRGLPYPGHGNWFEALHYFLTAGRLLMGWPLLWIGGIGALVALLRRHYWPVVLLGLWPAFIVWSMHSAAQPIHVPVLYPFSWYNTRYALAMLPLAAFGGGALVTGERKGWKAIGVLAICAGFWLVYPDHNNWITWKESEQNSLARRPWTRMAAEYLEAHAQPTDTFFTTFDDVSAIYREAGIHFTRTLTWNDNPEWMAAVSRPDVFLWEDWAVAQRGNAVDEAVKRARAYGVHYDLATEIAVPKSTPIEIYRRHEYPLR